MTTIGRDVEELRSTKTIFGLFGERFAKVGDSRTWLWLPAVAIASVAYYLVYSMTTVGALRADSRGGMSAAPGYSSLGRRFSPRATATARLVLEGAAEDA